MPLIKEKDKKKKKSLARTAAQVGTGIAVGAALGPVIGRLAGGAMGKILSGVGGKVAGTSAGRAGKQVASKSAEYLRKGREAAQRQYERIPPGYTQAGRGGQMSGSFYKERAERVAKRVAERAAQRARAAKAAAGGRLTKAQQLASRIPPRAGYGLLGGYMAYPGEEGQDDIVYRRKPRNSYRYERV